MRVNIFIPDDLLSVLDYVANDLGLSRSALIRLYCSRGLTRDYGLVTISDLTKLTKKELESSQESEV